MTKIPSGGSKDSVLIAISKSPSFNYTSHKKDAVAGFTLTRTIDNAVNTVAHTTFSGQPAYVLDQTTQPDCQGDEAGVGGGVKSGTVGKEVKPTSGSSNVFIRGKALVREGDTCMMNNGNVEGTYVSVNASWADAAVAQAEQDGGLWAGPGMYGTDEIPGSPAARERARLQGIKDRRQPVGKNDYVNFTKDGNHAYDYISKPVCSVSDPNCSIQSVVKVLNEKGVYPKQKKSISLGTNNISNADIPGPWGEDLIQSFGIYDNTGNQIGVRNETLEDHKLHPGVVQRTVILKGKNVHILTEGGGSGILGGPNVLLRDRTWGAVDQVVIDEFKK